MVVQITATVDILPVTSKAAAKDAKDATVTTAAPSAEVSKSRSWSR